jgi:hypothetical protein
MKSQITGTLKAIQRIWTRLLIVRIVGKKVTFGSCYTSKEIHTPGGFGYAVCGECYATERIKEEEWRKKQR